MANGMAGLFVGASGLKTAQTALNTTAHNLSNINTTGYTRQQVTFSDTTYVNVNSKDKVSYASYGLGVAISEVRRIRDQYIDLAYRNENSRLGFYESQYNAVQEIEDQFGEMQGVTYESYLTNLYDSINELAKNPTSTVARGSGITRQLLIHRLVIWLIRLMILQARYISLIRVLPRWKHRVLRKLMI